MKQKEKLLCKKHNVVKSFPEDNRECIECAMTNPKKGEINVACLSCGMVGLLPADWKKLECPNCGKPYIFPVVLNK